MLLPDNEDNDNAIETDEELDAVFSLGKSALYLSDEPSFLTGPLQIPLSVHKH